MSLTWVKKTPKNAPKLAWSQRLSVSNRAIDNEHMKLIALVNELEHAIRKRDADVLSVLFDQFDDAILAHFRSEATFAQAIGHPFDDHAKEHDYVLGEIQTMRRELLPANGRWSESVAEYYYSFLSEWAIRHISEDDMKMKARLGTLPYDFMPPDRTG